MNEKEPNLYHETLAERFVSLAHDEWFREEDIEQIRLALTELEEIKARAKESIKNLHEINVSMTSHEVKNRISLIKFIIKGEGK